MQALIFEKDVPLLETIVGDIPPTMDNAPNPAYYAALGEGWGALQAMRADAYQVYARYTVTQYQPIIAALEAYVSGVEHVFDGAEVDVAELRERLAELLQGTEVTIESIKAYAFNATQAFEARREVITAEAELSAALVEPTKNLQLAVVDLEERLHWINASLAGVKEAMLGGVTVRSAYDLAGIEQPLLDVHDHSLDYVKNCTHVHVAMYIVGKDSVRLANAVVDEKGARVRSITPMKLYTPDMMLVESFPAKAISLHPESIVYIVDARYADTLLAAGYSRTVAMHAAQAIIPTVDRDTKIGDAERTVRFSEGQRIYYQGMAEQYSTAAEQARVEAAALRVSQE